jgi:beta-galactosidase/beta-glucuronidase
MKILRILALLPVVMLPALRAADWKPADSPLTTQWTAGVSPTHAWPEYPRPQMERAKWTNLNGLWDYAIQEKAAGTPTKFDGQILTPYPVESALSGVKRPLLPTQRLWYRRTFATPRLKQDRLLLHFGAVDWRAEVFVNGTAVGTHEGGYDPFTFDITDALKPKAARQEIVVAVWDPTDSELHPRGKQVLNPNGIWYTAVSGIWQTVWLEPVPAAHIEALTLVPDIDGKRLRITVKAAGNATFTAVARLHGKEVGRVGGDANSEVSLPVSQLDLWSPDHPVLYDLEVQLKGGDRVKSYFGMRKIEVKKDVAGINRIFLNNSPKFLIGPLDQGWWPDGLYTAPSDEASRYDIEMLKKLGFNMCRKHVKVEPARWYYWCDKLGFMVWQDMPSAMAKGRPTGVKKNGADVEFTPDEDTAFRKELRAMIQNLQNAPSIVAWVPFNEGWGQHSTNEILRMVKALDPTRLVDAPSGWEDRGEGDMKDMHQYPGPGMYPVMPDRASVLGEFGGLGWPVEGHLWWNKRNWGYRTYTDQQGLNAAYEDVVSKLEPLIRAGLCAAVYTQTTDVEGEINGLMTYDRKVVKYDAAKLAPLHARLIAILDHLAAGGTGPGK